MKYIIIAAIGALASILANKGIAVFNMVSDPSFRSILMVRLHVKNWLP